MAKSCTLRTEGFHDSGTGTTANTASISPSAGAVAVWVFAYGTATMSATGNGLTYSPVINEPSVDGGRIFCLVGAGASPSAGAITLTFDDEAFVNWKVVSVTGTIQISGPTNANHAEADGTSTTPAVTLAAFAHASNGVLAYIYSIDSVAITQGTGFTLVDANEGTAMFGHSDAVMFRDDNDTSVDGTLSGSAAWGIAALELVDSSSSGGTVNTQTLSSTVSVVDAPLDYVFASRLGSDNVTVTDGPSEFFSIHNLEAISETTVTDGFLAWLRRHRVLEDNILVTDELISSVIGYLIYNSILSSNISVTDEAQKTAYFYRLAESSIVTEDQLLRALLVARDLLDGVEVTDSSLTSIQRFILLTDTISVEDALSALYVPDPGPITDNPVIRIGVDQPEVKLGGYSVN